MEWQDYVGYTSSKNEDLKVFPKFATRPISYDDLFRDRFSLAFESPTRKAKGPLRGMEVGRKLLHRREISV